MYIQLHYESDLGFKTHSAAKAAELDGTNPDSATQDLFAAIERGDFPSWTVSVQVMTADQAAKFRYSVNDLTKVWPKKDFPLRKIAKFTLNRNPTNYFAEVRPLPLLDLGPTLTRPRSCPLAHTLLQVEQAAFSPSHLIPGVEPSNDPVLQSRLFSYPDAQRYRLGQNYKSIPVNCPFAPVSNYQRSGPMVTDGNGGSAPNYPSSAEPMQYAKRPYTLAQIADPHQGSGVVSTTSEITDLDFEQPRCVLPSARARALADATHTDPSPLPLSPFLSRVPSSTPAFSTSGSSTRAPASASSRCAARPVPRARGLVLPD